MLCVIVKGQGDFMSSTVLVLGAGIVGVSVALHLQKRGFQVLLVDHGEAGAQTSFGNAGLIQSEGVFPYAFPQHPLQWLKYALNLTTEAHYHVRALPSLLPFLVRYGWHSRPSSHARIARHYAPLIAQSVSEHLALADEAQCRDLIAQKGWIRLFRTPQEMDTRVMEALQWHRDFGVNFATLTSDDLRKKEPSLDTRLVGALHWSDPCSVSDPYALTQSYAALFERLGGKRVCADALSLDVCGEGWRVHGPHGSFEGEQAVVCLGPWSDLLMRKFGYVFPFAVKRGYHMHYEAQEGTSLNHTVLDAERGYLLAPMTKGIRLTTGAEFAKRDAPSTPVQVNRAERTARTLFPLGNRLDAQPWMGSRPCTPDMLPIIGAAHRHKGLWTAFGHAHHGLTLGPVTGRLLTQMMSGEKPLCDPTPFALVRFTGA
jgi:D-amino-acid dehydrogenase